MRDQDISKLDYSGSFPTLDFPSLDTFGSNLGRFPMSSVDLQASPGGTIRGGDERSSDPGSSSDWASTSGRSSETSSASVDEFARDLSDTDGAEDVNVPQDPDEASVVLGFAPRFPQPVEPGLIVFGKRGQAAPRRSWTRPTPIPWSGDDRLLFCLSSIATEDELETRRVRNQICSPVHLFLPRPGEAMFPLPAGCTAITIDSLLAGVSYPLTGLVARILIWLGLPLFQIHPLSLTRLFCTFVLFSEAGFERPSNGELSWLFYWSADPQDSGTYHLSCRPARGCKDLISGVSDSLGEWRDKWLFVGGDWAPRGENGAEIEIPNDFRAEFGLLFLLFPLSDHGFFRLQAFFLCSSARERSCLRQVSS
jgi:hypothetical protein